MKINAEGIALIKSREACRLKAYKCPAGIWTIGYGHTGVEVHDGLEIDQDEAETLLRSDLIVFDAGVAKACPASTACQHSAMVSLAYNIGLERFAKSSVARLHNADRSAEAAQAFALWNKAAGVVLAGLVSRRAAEASLYLEDIAEEQVAAVPNGDGEQSLLRSRTLNGQALAGSGIAVSAALPSLKAMMPSAADVQGLVDSLGPAVTYLPSLGTLIGGLTVFGVGLTVYAKWHDRNSGRA